MIKARQRRFPMPTHSLRKSAAHVIRSSWWKVSSRLHANVTTFHRESFRRLVVRLSLCRSLGSVRIFQCAAFFVKFHRIRCHENTFISIHYKLSFCLPSLSFSGLTHSWLFLVFRYETRLEIFKTHPSRRFVELLSSCFHVVPDFQLRCFDFFSSTLSFSNSTLLLARFPIS